MKRIFCFITIIFFPSIYIYAQPDGTIYTPKGNSIEYYIKVMGDTAMGRAIAEDLISTNGWDATMVAPASGKYNCHSFAWNTSEGGSEYWIDGLKYLDFNRFNHDVPPSETPTNIAMYWTNNGGYSSSNRKANAKVYYGSEWVWDTVDYVEQWVNKKDHSAIVDSDTDYFISKWGGLPVYKHLPADCPYVGSELSLSYYYIDNPVISSTASGALCDNVQRTYSETAFSHIDLDYDWGCTSPLAQVGDDDESSYIVEGTSQNAQGTVSLTITTPSGATASDNENVSVSTTPIITGIDGPMSVPTNLDTRYYPLYWYLTASPPTNFEWNVTPDADYNSYGWSTLVNFPDPDVYHIIYRGLNTCGWGDWYMSDNIYVYSSRSLSVTPNPTSGETIIAIETADKKATSTTETEEMAFDETAEWELEIYDNVQTLIAKKTKLKGKEYRIHTAGWIDGVYMIKVKYKNEVLTGKLIVKG